jgi:HJR/Mrr/RecB family endonuclease
MSNRERVSAGVAIIIVLSLLTIGVVRETLNMAGKYAVSSMELRSTIHDD